MVFFSVVSTTLLATNWQRPVNLKSSAKLPPVVHWRLRRRTVCFEDETYIVGHVCFYYLSARNRPISIFGFVEQAQCGKLAFSLKNGAYVMKVLRRNIFQGGKGFAA